MGGFVVILVIIGAILFVQVLEKQGIVVIEVISTALVDLTRHRWFHFLIPPPRRQLVPPCRVPTTPESILVIIFRKYQPKDLQQAGNGNNQENNFKKAFYPGPRLIHDNAKQK